MRINTMDIKVNVFIVLLMRRHILASMKNAIYIQQNHTRTDSQNAIQAVRINALQANTHSSTLFMQCNIHWILVNLYQKNVNAIVIICRPLKYLSEYQLNALFSRLHTKQNTKKKKKIRDKNCLYTSINYLIANNN